MSAIVDKMAVSSRALTKAGVVIEVDRVVVIEDRVAVIEVDRVVVTRGVKTGTGETVTEVVEEEEATKGIVTIIETTGTGEIRTEVAGSTTATAEVISTTTAGALVVSAAVEMSVVTRARAPVLVGGSGTTEGHPRAGMVITMVVVAGGDRGRKQSHTQCQVCERKEFYQLSTIMGM